MKTFPVIKKYLFLILSIAWTSVQAQTSIKIQQETHFNEFGTVWVEYVYLTVNGGKNLNLPYAFDTGNTLTETNNKKANLINAIKKNTYGTLGHNIWNSSNDCSKTLFALRHGSNAFVIVVVKVANTGNDDTDFLSSTYNWVENSKGISEAKVGIMLDRKIVKSSADFVKVSSYISCPTNNYKAWIQDVDDVSGKTKRNLKSYNDTHFSINGIDKNVNIYLSCDDDKNATFAPIQYNTILANIDLKTTESECKGTNRFITISPSGGAGKYDFFVDGTNPSDSNTSPSDPNHCNSSPDYLYFSPYTPPGQTGVSLTAGQNYNFRVKDAYQEVVFPVSVSACNAAACEANFDFESISATKCGIYTTFSIKAKELNGSPFTAQFSLDNINWFDANAETNQYKFTVTQNGSCRTFWAKAKGCSDPSKVKTSCLADTSASYAENCLDACGLNLALEYDKATVTTCGTQSTFTVRAREKSNLPFVPQFSPDKITWYAENAGTNQYRFSLTQNNTCRGIYVKPAGCEENSRAKWACFNDTDASYGATENCLNPCGVNILYDQATATSCGNRTTFTVKVKEKNGFPFIPQFSTDSLTWYDANDGVNQYKFSVTKNNSCRGFWTRIKGCPDVSKIKWACLQDTDVKYPSDCEGSIILADEPETIENVIISPNPVIDFLQAEIYLTKKVPLSISLKNNSGQEMFSKEMGGSFGKNIVNFDLTDYTNGIYFISIKFKEKQIIKKIIKM